MSHVTAHSAAPRRLSASLALARMLVLSLLLSLSHGVWAEPAAANQLLAVTKQNFAQLKERHLVAKLQLQAGQPNAAVLSFIMAKEHSAQMSDNLVRLANENRHTLQNGLYQNGAAQQQAVDYNAVAKNSSQLLQTKLLILTLQPTSQVDQILAEHALTKLSDDMIRLEQAMIAAQQ